MDITPEGKVTGNAILLTGTLYGALALKSIPYYVVEVDPALAQMTIEHVNGNRYVVAVRQIGGKE